MSTWRCRTVGLVVWKGEQCDSERIVIVKVGATTNSIATNEFIIHILFQHFAREIQQLRRFP